MAPLFHNLAARSQPLGQPHLSGRASTIQPFDYDEVSLSRHLLRLLGLDWVVRVGVAIVPVPLYHGSHPQRIVLGKISRKSATLWPPMVETATVGRKLFTISGLLLA